MPMFAASSRERISRLMRSLKPRISCVQQRKRTASSTQLSVMRKNMRLDICGFDEESLLQPVQFGLGKVRDIRRIALYRLQDDLLGPVAVIFESDGNVHLFPDVRKLPGEVIH